jgi:glycosyltransferase involved in cell wall biosynthesis
VLPHYRVPFYAKLYEDLLSQCTNLAVICGQENPGTVPKSVLAGAPWEQRIENRYFQIAGTEFVWQPCWSEVQDADLVIVEQANRLLINYLVLLRRKLGWGPKIAFWGHGRNMQSLSAESFREKIKRRLVTEVDWWFAYTKLSAETVALHGFPQSRITVVENAIDTSELVKALAAVSPYEIQSLRYQLGIGSEHVAIYCGGMYADKRLDFLIKACVRIRELVVDFEMIFIGDGPEQHKIGNAAAKYPWVHYVGAKFGAERVPYFKIAKAQLMPGLVGLAIIDSFTTGVPLFTTDIPIHSPEIAYLENGVNGVMTGNGVEVYAAAVAEVMTNEELLPKLKVGCSKSAARYTIENMVENFADGIQRCLNS